MLFLSLVSYRGGDYESLTNSVSVKNVIGPLGALISHGLRTAFGLSSYMLTGIFVLSGLSFIRHGSIYKVMEKIFSLFFFTIVLSALITVMSAKGPLYSGGYIGQYQHHFFKGLIGPFGAALVIFIMNLIGLILMGILSLNAFLDFAGDKKPVELLMKMIRTKAAHKKLKKNLPLNSIGRDAPPQTGKKLPWITSTGKVDKKMRLPFITRQRMLISGDGDHAENDSMKYLEMQVPRAASDQFSSLNRYDSYIKNRGDEVVENSPGFTDSEDRLEAKDIEDVDFSVTSYPDTVDDTLDFDEEERDVSDCADFCEDYLESAQENRENREIKINRLKSINVETIKSEKEADEDIYNDSISCSPHGGSNSSKKTDREQDLSRSERLVFSEINLNSDYIIPVDFLHSAKPVDTESWMTEVKKNSLLLVNTLADFGIESKVVNVNRGPVITLYELQIAPGIKVNRIVGLADDIAMALAAYRVRIVAPIPGKSAIGVEIPNRLREKVTLGDIIRSEHYQKKEGFLKVALGKDILGKPVTLDLKKLPHLLIAGATGAGKSVCVNAIINSLVYNYDPNYVRFIMVDPKMVDLQLYNGLPHLLTPVIIEPFVAPTVLKWAVYEMERRYRLLSELNTRDIQRYNEKITMLKSSCEHLPYIVIIIDELADLMMVAAKEIEGYITRIAQKARAVGIHLVLATQRPSVDIITGIIKANFPARVAFQVAQKTDSRTIIDQNGAEKLLGKGDMLYQSPNGSYPVRIQGAFVSEDEITSVVEHLSYMGEPDYIDIEESIFDAESEIDDDDQADELFVEALKIVEETRKASASYLQRRLSIGYNRAARIIEMMEDRGYIGPQQGSKPREVLI